MEPMYATLPRPQTSGAAKKGKGSDGWELNGLNVEMAENGYTVRCSYERESKGKKAVYEDTYRSENKVFESARSLIEFLEEALEGARPKKGKG